MENPQRNLICECNLPKMSSAPGGEAESTRGFGSARAPAMLVWVQGGSEAAVMGRGGTHTVTRNSQHRWAMLLLFCANHRKTRIDI